jgi:hypothetical protein
MRMHLTRGARDFPAKLPVNLERRGDGRIHTVMRVAKVSRALDSGLWRVRNIWDGGMMLALAARAVWWDGARCGGAFERPIDCAELLHDLVAEQRAPRYRPPRLPAVAF